MLWEISSCGIILLRVVSAGVSVSLLKFEKPVLSVNSEFLDSLALQESDQNAIDGLGRTMEWKRWLEQLGR